MIYIGKAVAAPCKGCGKACDETCKCCSQVCDPCCKAFDRPLGGFVLMSVVLCLPAAVCAVLGLISVKDCTAKPMPAFCMGNIVLGFLHVAFAFYIQRKVLSGMINASTGGGSLSSSQPGMPDGGMPSSKELMSNAWNLLLYDVCTCLYMFVFAGSFIFQFMGLTWSGGCSGTGMAVLSAVLLIFFAMGSCCFLCMWWCLLSCEQCFGGFSSSPNTGLAKMVLGKNILSGVVARPGQPATAQPATYGQQQPAYGQPAPYAQATYAQPAPQQGYAQPPPAQQQQKSGGAAQATGSALEGVGSALTALGGMMGGKKGRT